MLTLSMLFGVIPAKASQEETSAAEDAKVYMTVSNKGIIAKAEDESIMANREVTVEDINKDGKLSVDEALTAAHKAYNSEEGYSAEDSAEGGYVSKLWGESTSNVLFFVNNEGITTGVTADTVKEGDFLVASINSDNQYYADWYTFFDKSEAEAYVNEDITLCLKGHIGMTSTEDDKINIPLEGISIGEWKNGSFEAVEKSTDENGNVKLSFKEPGTYYITADGTVLDSVMDWGTGKPTDAQCPIIAPVCKAVIKQVPEKAIVENIINKYKASGVAEDGNIEWFLADFAAYEALNPSESVLNAEQKQAALDKLIENISEKTDKPSNLAKTIIALRAMGYDARKVYKKDGEKLDLVEKLTDLSQSTAAANTYTLPYVLIALQQSEDYITEETEKYLIDTALAGKAAWTQWGLDGATPMVLALAPYYNENEAVKDAIDEVLEAIGEGQSDSGAIVNYGSDNAASTGLAIAAAAAVGKSAADIKKSGKSLIDGIMSMANEELNAFKPVNNTFATEQGLRGLLAQQLLENEKNLRVYDFKKNPMNEARATTEGEGGNQGSEDGSSEESNPGQEKITVYFTLYGDEIHGAPKKEKDEHTLKKGNLDEWISKTKVLMDKESTAMDLVEKMLKENDIEYINEDGYLSEIKGLGELDNGALSGWMYTLNGEHPKTIGLAEYVLEDGDIIVLHYTDDYKQEEEKKSSGSSGSSSSGSSSNKKTDSSVNIPIIIIPNSDSNTEEITFVDVKLSDWFYEAVKYVTLKKLMNGTDKGFEPDLNMSRAMLVTVLYRLAGMPEITGSNKFSDVADGEWYTAAVIWAAENEIVNGISETEFAPNENVTREQLAAIIYRYAKFRGNQTENTASLEEFTDCEEISDWAKTAFLWARAKDLINGTAENTLSPKANATRAQVAVILMRFLELK